MGEENAALRFDSVSQIKTPSLCADDFAVMDDWQT
jgi:hypothetical protein